MVGLKSMYRQARGIPVKKDPPKGLSRPLRSARYRLLQGGTQRQANLRDLIRVVEGRGE